MKKGAPRYGEPLAFILIILSGELKALWPPDPGGGLYFYLVTVSTLVLTPSVVSTLTRYAPRL